MNRRTAILTATGLGILACSSSVVFLFLRNYSHLDLDLLRTKKVLIAEIADTILPRTETPGAKDAKVEDFIISMITDCTDNKSKYNFIKGLEKLEKLSAKTFNKSFIYCTSSERLLILSELERHEILLSGILQRIRTGLMGNGFLYLMKYYTVMGYCTSKIGATQGVAYDFIPGSYMACIPLSSAKCWATE